MILEIIIGLIVLLIVFFILNKWLNFIDIKISEEDRRDKKEKDNVFKGILHSKNEFEGKDSSD